MTAEILVAGPSDAGSALGTFISLEGDVLILLPQRLDKAALVFFLVESLKEVDRRLQVI